MKLDKLFSLVKIRWPEVIDISDAKLLSGGGFLSWELVRCEEQAGENVPAGEGLIEVAIWPFHQALCAVARVNAAMGGTTVATEQVEIDDFAKNLAVAFEEPCWHEEREIYRQSNPTS